jgi:hypothetical protein
MMNRVLTIVLLAAALSCTQTTFGQAMGSGYRTALGVKFYPGAITLKHFTADNRALEGIASFWNYGFRFTGLYEIHGDIDGAEGLKWYVGPGAHIGAYNNDWENKYPDRSSGMQIGIDGVLGLDYKFNGAPINLSLDIQPFFNIASYSYFDVWGGFAVRYAF